MADATLSERALTFEAAGERLAIGADIVSEVIRLPALTRVPLAPPSLAGVANLRGAVIPVVSVDALLNRHEAQREAKRIIVVRHHAPVGLMVGEVASLVSSERIRSGEEGARLIDVNALLDAEFDAVARPARAAFATRPAAPSTSRSARERAAFLSFAVGRQEFALPLDSVREVIALPREIAIVPRTDDAMIGVVPVRDRLLPLISLAVLLGLEAGAPASARVVVASIGGAGVGLIVDDVRGIVRVNGEEIDPVPAVLTRGSQEAQIRAICRLDGGRRLVSILSTEHLLKDGLGERLARDQGEDGSAEMEQSESGATEQFVIFRLGEESYGLPIASVEEIVSLPDKLTRLPRSPAFVEGVINLRGRVIPVIDQRRRFEARDDDRGRRPRIIVVRIAHAEAGFIVDEVSEVLRVEVERIREAPDIAVRGARVIDRIANLTGEGRMILLVDAQELLDRAEQDILARMQSERAAPS